MARRARDKGSNCIYHIVERGNERKDIFNNDDDKLRFIDTLIRVKHKFNYKIYAYCLMDNHVHLLIDDNGSDISDIMHSINVSYVCYFNKVYSRCGHLFQNRFDSSIVDNANYLLEASRYIHNNPVKANMVENPIDYKWSSYNAYMGEHTMLNSFVDTSLILSSMSYQTGTAIEKYKEYVTTCRKYIYKHIDAIYEEKNINSINNAKEYFEKLLGQYNITLSEINNNKGLRKNIIKELYNTMNLKYEDIGMLFGGLSKSAVCKIIHRAN